MAQTGEDCYFYYYSQCKNGSACSYRHSPYALGSETVCTLWRAGKCTRPLCKFRHMEIQIDRTNVPCYWESQPGGCKKPHCVFKHFSIKEDKAAPTSQAEPAPAVSQHGEKPEAKPQEAAPAFPPRDMHRSSPKIEPVVVNCEDDSDLESSPVKKLQREAVVAPSAPSRVGQPRTTVISTRKAANQESSNANSNANSSPVCNVKPFEQILREKLLKKIGATEKPASAEEENRCDENIPGNRVVEESDRRLTKIINRQPTKVVADAREVITEEPVAERKVVNVHDNDERKITSTPSVQPSQQNARKSPPKMSVLQRLGKKVDPCEDSRENENLPDTSALTSLTVTRKSPVEEVKVKSLAEIRAAKHLKQEPSTAKPRKLRRVMLVDNAANEGAAAPQPKPAPVQPARARIRLNRAPLSHAGQLDESQPDEAHDSSKGLKVGRDIKGQKAVREDKAAPRMKREIQLYVPPRKRNGDSVVNDTQESAEPAKKQRTAPAKLSPAQSFVTKEKKPLSLKRPQPEAPAVQPDPKPAKKVRMSEAKTKGVVIKSFMEIMAEKQKRIEEQKKQAEGSGSPPNARFSFKPVTFDVKEDEDSKGPTEKSTASPPKRSPPKWRVRSTSGSLPSSPLSSTPSTSPTKAPWRPSVQVAEVSSPAKEESAEVSSSSGPLRDVARVSRPIPINAVAPRSHLEPDNAKTMAAAEGSLPGSQSPSWLFSSTPESAQNLKTASSYDSDSVDKQSNKELQSVNSLIDDPVFEDDDDFNSNSLSGVDEIDDSELLEDIDKLLE